MSDKPPAEISRTPTDPSLEFDLFETVRLRLAGVLSRRGYDPIEAERIALYVVESARPFSHFLKVLTGPAPPADEAVVSALGKILDEHPALEKAQRLLLRRGPGDPA